MVTCTRKDPNLPLQLDYTQTKPDQNRKNILSKVFCPFASVVVGSMTRLKNFFTLGQMIFGSSACQIVLGIFSVVLYVQDILQDALVISTAISSKETYSVLSNFHVLERSLGLFMAFVFGFR